MHSTLRDTHLTVIVGNSLKDNFKGYQAWAFSASSADLKIIHLKADKKYLLMNAKLESQLVGYTIFKGENPVTPEV